MKGRPKIADAITVKAYTMFRRIGSVQGTAKEMNLAPQTVRRWRDTIFAEWDRDPEVFEAIKARGETSVASSCQSQELTLLQSMLTTVNEVLKEGQVKPKKWPEVLDTVKLVLDRLSRLIPKSSSTEEEPAELDKVKDLMGTMARALEVGGKSAREQLNEYKEEIIQNGELEPEEAEVVPLPLVLNKEKEPKFEF